MQYKVDFDIENFEFWGGAKDVLTVVFKKINLKN